MTDLVRAGAGALILALLAGCATTSMGTPGDPLERMNRATYRFNDAVDRAVLKPVATGYRDHVPKLVQQGVDNVLEHLAFPTTIVNDLLQLKIKDTLVDLGRFAVNSTIGIAGLLDPASHVGIPKNDEDFGQTLGRWGVPSGPYVVIPFLGPSTMRDAPALYADAQTDLRVALDLEPEVEWSLVGISLVHRRSELLPFDAQLEAAFDRYAFIRNAWLQRREYQVRDGDVADDPLGGLEDPAELGDPEPPGEAPRGEAPSSAPPAAEPPPPETPPTAPPAEEPVPDAAGDQPPAETASSSATSLMLASETIADGRFR